MQLTKGLFSAQRNAPSSVAARSKSFSFIQQITKELPACRCDVHWQLLPRKCRLRSEILDGSVRTAAHRCRMEAAMLESAPVPRDRLRLKSACCGRYRGKNREEKRGECGCGGAQLQRVSRMGIRRSLCILESCCDRRRRRWQHPAIKFR
jgi:hypothetical protein